MTNSFQAYQITKDGDQCKATLRDCTDRDLMDGDVTVNVEYSTLNYKDGLAMTAGAPVVRHFPLIPGIDFSGTVLHSDNERFAPGASVLLTGFGVGEVHHGGFSEKARVKGDWLMPVPEGLTTRQAMVIGTAGFTSMLCVLALEKHGILPEHGNILVTGAAGGVGSVALLILSQLGYRVVAVTGRSSEHEFLKSLGAAEVIDRETLSGKARPIAREKWVGAIDVAGGNTLANVLSEINYGGAVAACGLADSMDLPASVAPFILRGITLYGIDSVMAPMAVRKEAWKRIARDVDFERLEELANEISLEEVPEAAKAILTGSIRGRTVIRVGNP